MANPVEFQNVRACLFRRNNVKETFEGLPKEVIDKFKYEPFVPSTKLQTPELSCQNVWVPLFAAGVSKDPIYVNQMRLIYSLPEIREFLYLAGFKSGDLFLKDSFTRQLEYLYDQTKSTELRRMLVDAVGIRGIGRDGRGFISWGVLDDLKYSDEEDNLYRNGITTVRALPRYLLVSHVCDCEWTGDGYYPTYILVNLEYRLGITISKSNWVYIVTLLNYIPAFTI